MPKRKFSSTNASRKRTRPGRFGFRRTYRKRRSKLGKPSRGLRQSTYLFKRQTTSVVQLNEVADGTGWFPSGDNGMYKQWVFNLDQLTGVGQTDFTSLFKQYKICACKVELSFNSTASVISSVDVSQSNVVAGAQLQVYTTPNRSGRYRDVSSNPLTETELMHTQAKTKRLALNGGHPLKYYMRVNQLGMIYVSPTDTDYSVQRPQFLSTGETGAEHYGLEMYVNRVDNLPLSSNLHGSGQTLRQTVTYYLAFKGVE